MSSGSKKTDSIPSIHQPVINSSNQKRLSLSHQMTRKPCEGQRVKKELLRYLQMVSAENQRLTFLTLSITHGSGSLTVGFQIFSPKGRQVSVFLPRSSNIAKSRIRHYSVCPLISILKAEGHEVLELKGNKPAKHIGLISKYLGLKNRSNAHTNNLKKRAEDLFKN